MSKTLVTSPLFFLAIVLAMASCADAADTVTDPAARVPDEIRNVGIDEHPGQPIALDAVFVNEHGEERGALSTYFNHGRPVILQLGYFECPMLCSLVSRGMMDTIKELNLSAGKDFDMLFVSIDPTETPSLAALKRQNTVEYFGRPQEADGFHFMVGRQPAITALASSVGFRYQEVPDSQQFAHAAALFILTPEGKVSRYLYGVKYPPQTMRLSLVEASAGKIGTTFDRILLICLHYDSASQHYALAIGMMRAGGLLTVMLLGGTMFWLFRREFRTRGLPPAPGRISERTDDELHQELN